MPRRLSPQSSKQRLHLLRQNILKSLELLSKGIKADNKNLEKYLEEHGDLQVRDSSNRPVEGSWKSTMAVAARSSVKTLIETLVLLEQKLGIEGAPAASDEDEEEAEDQDTDVVEDPKLSPDANRRKKIKDPAVAQALKLMEKASPSNVVLDNDDLDGD